MKKIRLKELLENAGKYTVVRGSLDKYIYDIADSSKDVVKGSLFICVKGLDADGHQYTLDAVKKGASVIIAERDVKVAGSQCTVIRVADTKKTRSSVVMKAFESSRKKVSITGITGTNGKTTVSYLVDAMLKEEFKKQNSVIGTVKYKIAGKEYDAKTTTPSNIRTNKLVDESAAKNVKHLIMEASSHALDQGRIETIVFDTAVITNITRDHLDYHKTFRNYLNAKLKILDNLKKGGVIVVNRDFESSLEVIKAAKKKKAKVITYSMDEKADIQVVKYASDLNGVRFTLEIMGRKVSFESALIGEHNIYNIMAAIGAVLGKVSIKSIKEAVRKFRTVKGRLETVFSGDFTVLVDYAHTPDSLEQVLKALNSMCRGKIITVFGAAGNRDKGKRPLMGRIAAEMSDVAIITSDNPRYEDPEKIIKEVEAGVKHKRCVIAESDREKAIRAGIKMARPGDIVLIAGKGHEDYQEIKGIKHYFDDTETALKILNDRKVVLKDLLYGVEGYRIVQGNVEVPVRRIEESSKKAVKGSMFICIKGYKFDGHNFAKEAVKRGASIIIAEKDIKGIKKGVTVVRVKDTKKALISIVDAFYKDIKSRIQIIGVTGTNGKTTVSYLIGEMLKEQYKKENAILGTISYRIGKTKYKAPNTTPSNLTTHKMIDEAVKKGIKYLIMEVSSHALDQGRVANIKFDAAVITNITRDHLDYHKTFQDYVNAKMKIAACIKPGGILVLNADDKNSLKAVFKRNENVKLITYAMRAKADIKAGKFITDTKGCKFDVNISGKKGKLSSKLIGEHNIYNILSAVGAVKGRVDIKNIQKAVKKFNTLKGRLERVYTNGITVFIDFAHTPDGLEKVMESLNKIKINRLISVFGTAGDRDKGKRPLMGAIAEKLSDVVIVTSDNPRFENPAMIINDIMRGIKRKKSIIIEPDRKKAIKLGIKVAEKGDLILITGKGHQMYQEVMGRKIFFDDRKIALSSLKGKR